VLAAVPSLVASGLVPAAGVLAGAAAVTAVSTAVASAPAQASLSGPVLILSTSVNGGSSSTEAQQATALGLTVTVATPTTWDAMTQAQFAAYKAIIIGDPSGASCSGTVPADALSTAATWGAAVNGNAAVLGTAPALGGATTLISDAIAYAASSGTGKTGLYVSLNCEYSTATAGTAVPLLASVDGGGFTATGQGSHCPSDDGSVNTWQALALSPFNGLTSGNLGPWSSPACSVEETFNAWPAALGGLGYYKGASPASFTASDGATGQAYLLAGAPASPGTAALAPSTGGQTPAGATTGGGNPAAPGLAQNTAADPVNTENGDFTESATDISIPTYGPSLDFTRSYDAQAAQSQTQTGKPGLLGYGWTDNWATSLAGSLPVPGDIYTIDGLATAGASGGATQVPLNYPQTTITNNGNIYIADTAGNRIEEVPAASGTQWGISMTAGNMYTIAGSPTGNFGISQDGTPASQSLLLRPTNMVIDPSGNLFIADSGNNRVVEIPAVSGQNRGNGAMTVNDMYTIAGNPGGNAGHSGDGNNAAAGPTFLNDPVGLANGSGNGDLYIADAGNNRVQEIPATGGIQWGQSMTANVMYTVAGDPAGTAGRTGNGTTLALSRLTTPEGLGTSSGGDLYIADTGNNRIVEAASSGGMQWGISMTQNDMYTVAGSGAGTSGHTGNGGVATAALLSGPTSVVCNNGTQLYIADSGNNRIQEVARTGHTEWNVVMTANDIYTVAGSAVGTAGFSGDGGAATSALLNNPGQVTPVGNLYIADTNNNRVRQVTSAGIISEFAGDGDTLSSAGNGGPAINGQLYRPSGQAEDPQGNIYIADAGNNRIVEIAASTHSQWGFNLTAGHVSTIAGSAKGKHGSSGDGGPAVAALLNNPNDIAIDSAGNLYIADSGNNRIQKVNASTGNISTIAGPNSSSCSPTCQAGFSGDGGPATAARLSNPAGIEVDTKGDVYIADQANNRIQEIFAAGGHAWNQTMTAGNIYTVAGPSSSSCTQTPPNPPCPAGTSGDGGPANSALLNQPQGVATDAAGNLYIADWGNNRVQEVAIQTGVQRRGPSLTANDIYTIAGSASGTAGVTGDGGPATAALLRGAGRIASDAAGNIYIGDGSNRRIQEIPADNGTQWGQQMKAGHMYTVAGSAAGVKGESGDGGPATSALMSYAMGISIDYSGNLYITDLYGGLLREVVSAGSTPFPVYPTPGSTTGGTTYPGGVTITQDNGSQATFYPVQNGCFAPYTAVQSGQYCTLPENVGANLSYNGTTYTFTPQPGQSYTYNSAGQLTGQSDAAGDTLSVAYGTPLPGQGNCPAGATWCQLITSASGRALTVGYNASNLITSVTDPMGRTWTYGYTGSDLASVSDPVTPNANVTTYTYGAGSTGNPLNANNLLTITSPNAQPLGPDAGKSTVNQYDASGRVTQQTDPMGYVTQFAYAVNPSTGTGITTVTDPDGNTTLDAYSQGTLTATSKWTGGTTLTSEQDYVPDQAITIGDNSAGTQLDTATADGNGNITTTAYDTKGNPVTVTAPDGIGSQTGTTTKQSTSLGQVDCASTITAAQTCQQAGGPSSVAPGGVITPPSSAPPQGETWSLYDTDGNKLYTTIGVYEPGSQTAAYSQTTYQLFKNNTVTLGGTIISCANNNPPSLSLPCAIINADGVVTQLTYNTNGDLTSSSTPDGNGTEVAKTTYTYNGDGNQNSVTSPDGNLVGANAGNYTTVTVYGVDQQKTSVTQAGGTGATATPRTTNYGYDANLNQTAMQDPRGHTTTTTYNADDRATLVTDPDNNATLTCYDGDGNTTQTVPAAGVAANSLTPASCPTAYPSGYGNRLASDATTYTFDASGNQTAITTPAPAGQTGHETTTYSYDGNGQNIQTTAPPTTNGGANQVTVDSYNAAGNLVAETTGYGTTDAATISYCYDPNGNQTSVVYPDGNVPPSGVAPCETSSPWIVDPNGHQTQARYQTTSSYDSAGELVSTTAPATAAAPSGATTTSTFDPAGNTLTRTDPNGVTTTWTYTPLNKPATVTYSGSSAHSVTFGYDADGYQTAMSDATGSSSYVRDPFGELTSATNGAGKTTGYGYNADSQVASVTYPLPPSATWATSPTVSYTYDNADLLTGVTDFNGNQITIGNTADHLANSATLGASGDTITTTYDDTGSPSAISLKNGPSTLQSFTYTDSPGGTVLNETDTPSSSQSPAAYTYDAKGRVTSMTPGTNPTLAYSFDASSNLTTLPAGGTGSYDPAGELTSATQSGTTTNYTYNADGQRLTAKQGLNTVASGTWNGAGQLAAYYSAAANMTAATYNGYGVRATATTGGSTDAFTWNAVSQIPQLIMDSGRAYIYGNGLAPAEQVDLTTGAATYLVTDALGSVRGTVGSTGVLTGTTNYDAWGNPGTNGGLTGTTPFGFAGAYTDQTGLLYLLSRYYDPQVGQFTSVDPLLSKTAQPYAYAGGNPITNTDPSGKGFYDWAYWGGYSTAKGLIPGGTLFVNFRGHGMWFDFLYAEFATWRNLPHPTIDLRITWNPYGPRSSRDLIVSSPMHTAAWEHTIIYGYEYIPRRFDGAAVVVTLWSWYHRYRVAKTVDEICRWHC
jgi:RHS repeat-associated protein